MTNVKITKRIEINTEQHIVSTYGVYESLEVATDVISKLWIKMSNKNYPILEIRGGVISLRYYDDNDHFTRLIIENI